MKKIFKFLFAVGESFGRARAASYFTRMGDYQSARKVMFNR